MAYAKPKEKKQVKRPDPKILGTGMARKAGEALKGRKKALDDKIRKAGG